MGKGGYKDGVRIIATRTLREFYSQPRHQGAQVVIETWVAIARAAAWTNPMEVKSTLGQADILQDGRVVFDLGGNKYRLIGKINYRNQIIYIRFIGTHAEYDRINAQNV